MALAAILAKPDDIPGGIELHPPGVPWLHVDLQQLTHTGVDLRAVNKDTHLGIQPQ